MVIYTTDDTALGYHCAFTAAGDDVPFTGIDIAPQQQYPFRFLLADALTSPIADDNLVHASPPSQEYNAPCFLDDAVHPDARSELLDSSDFCNVPEDFHNRVESLVRQLAHAHVSGNGQHATQSNIGRQEK